MKGKLFTSYSLAKLNLRNRFVMAPMTRSRSSQPGDVPNALMAKYYAQRASAGLIITEATQVSLQGKGYMRTPGIYTLKQMQGWKSVTEAVHKEKAKIFLQLWHVGRVSSSLVNGLQPIAPSACKAKDTSVYLFNHPSEKEATFVPVETPREMTIEDINQVVEEFAHGAKMAIQAGFDGVEIHGANGYLLDQFLRKNSNYRLDAYGGTPEKRIRFLMQVMRAVIQEVGAEKVGVRLSPFIKFKDMDDSEILDTILLAVKELNDLDIAYLHLCEADWDDAPQIPETFRIELRRFFHATIIATGNKTPEEAEYLLRQGWVDLVGFGRKFIANPDYPIRVEKGAPLNSITNTHTLFGGGDAQGYTDYPYWISE